MRSPKQVRKAAGLSLDKAAAFSGVSAPTAKLYEIDRDAVTLEKRIALDRFYEELAHNVDAKGLS